MSLFDNIEKTIKEDNPAPAPAEGGEAEKITLEEINNLISNGLKSASAEIQKTCADMIAEALKNVSTGGAPAPAEDKEENKEE